MHVVGFWYNRMMRYDYFIASRWRNKDNVLSLAIRLRQLGKSVYCFVDPETSHLDPLADAEEAMKSFEAITDWHFDPGVRELFKRDIDALKESHLLIMLLPAGKSAHIEAGLAYGLGKKCVVIGEQQETESLYLIFNEWYPTSDDFINSL